MVEPPDSDAEPIPGIGNPPPAKTMEWLLAHPDYPVCDCFQVPVEGLLRLLEERRPESVREIGRICGAGTDCGSCLGMLREFLERWKAGQ